MLVQYYSYIDPLFMAEETSNSASLHTSIIFIYFTASILA